MRDVCREDSATRGNFVVFAVLAAWPWIGLLGHEPWKADEAYTFGLVYSYLEGRDWLVPVLADSYFLEKPPIFFWAAAASARLFGSFLPLPEAARIAVPFFLYLTLGSLMATGGILLGRARAWIPPLLFVGALGLFDKVHMLITEITRRIEIDPLGVDCDYLIAQLEPSDSDLAAPSRWQRMWRGTRPGDTKEALELYRRR